MVVIIDRIPHAVLVSAENLAGVMQDNYRRRDRNDRYVLAATEPDKAAKELVLFFRLMQCELNPDFEIEGMEDEDE